MSQVVCFFLTKVFRNVVQRRVSGVVGYFYNSIARNYC